MNGKKVGKTWKAAGKSYYKQPLGFPVSLKETWQAVFWTIIWGSSSLIPWLGRAIVWVWVTYWHLPRWARVTVIIAIAFITLVAIFGLRR